MSGIVGVGQNLQAILKRGKSETVNNIVKRMDNTENL